MFPNWIGLSLWNLFNSLLLLFAIYYLPKLDNLQKGISAINCFNRIIDFDAKSAI